MLNIFYPIFSTQQKHQPANKSAGRRGNIIEWDSTPKPRKFLFRDVAGLPTFWEQLKIVKEKIITEMINFIKKNFKYEIE